MTGDLASRLVDALRDRYRIERELGGGGMSRVFLAEELALGRKVVVKLLPPDLGPGVNIDRFQREIHLAASLQHPHIVPVLAAGSAEGLLYYTMPLVEGESLRARLAREGELPIPVVVRLLRDVADALAYAHDHGVLHRDIKPDNILVSRQHALVTDFGVAKALSAAAGEGSGTTEGLALGTPAYMAPEQATADPHIDHRADIYALGVVAYETLTGNALFPGLTGQAVLAAQATRRPPAVTELRPSIPPALAALVTRCLEKRPADRPQSASEVLHDLDLLTASPGSGVVPTAVVRTSRTARRRNWILAAGVLGAALLLSTFWVRRPVTSATLDTNLVAVAPFDALGQELELWREGLVDILSRNLDGAGQLRTVAPTIVVRRWSGRADPASAAALGQRTGAGLAVFGNLVWSGQDSIRLSATLLDVKRNRAIGEVQLRGDSRHMDRLSDSLTVGILRLLAQERDLAAVRTSSLRATSLPALKAFLEGEQLYRRGSWDSAQLAYRKALSIDSSFVPAIWHLAHALWWRGSSDTAYRPYLARAGELNHGLPRRDSLLIAADSIWVNLQDVRELPAEVRRSLLRRQLEMLEEGVRLYPDDPEFWYQLGEKRYHLDWDWLHQTPAEQILEAFDRAIALDSSFVPAQVHRPSIVLSVYDKAAWDRYVSQYLQSGARRGAEAATVRLLDAVFRAQTTSPDRIDSIVQSSPAEALSRAIFEAWRLPDSLETGIMLARAFVTRRDYVSDWMDEPRFRRQALAGALAFRGHLREAHLLLGEEEQPGLILSWPAEIALAAPVDPERTDSMFARWLRRGPLWTSGGWPLEGPPGSLIFALPWWAARQDTLALAHFARRADSARRAAVLPIEAEIGEYGSQAALAYIVLVRRDTSEALRRFQALPHDVFWGTLDRVIEGQILARRGRDAEAFKLLDGAFYQDWCGPYRVLTSLELGRIAERLGRRDRATTEYQFVLAAWRQADPELQHYVDEARQGLARLTAEPRR